MGSNTASVAVTGVDIRQGGFSHTKDQVVAEFDLREEQLVLAAGLPALAFGKERSQGVSHFRPQLDRSSAVRVSASSWRRLGVAHRRKALEHCWKSRSCSHMRFASDVN
jgi:hypothetical protein